MSDQTKFLQVVPLFIIVRTMRMKNKIEKSCRQSTNRNNYFKWSISSDTEVWWYKDILLWVLNINLVKMWGSRRGKIWEMQLRFMGGGGKYRKMLRLGAYKSPSRPSQPVWAGQAVIQDCAGPRASWAVCAVVPSVPCSCLAMTVLTSWGENPQESVDLHLLLSHSLLSLHEVIMHKYVL